MIDPIFQSGTYQLARKLLDASVLRQEALASNVANVETPGYKRIDVASDFATQLKTRMEAGERLPSSDELKPALVEDLQARSVRPDGNSVELDHEMIEMNRNSVEYDYLTEIVSQNIKQMKLAISGH